MQLGNQVIIHFLQWVHESELRKQIRFLNGTRSGTLRVERTNQYEDTGYYICRVSNGIPDIKRKTIQEAKMFFISEGMQHIMKFYWFCSLHLSENIT